MEAVVIVPGDDGEEGCGPRAGVAAIFREAEVDAEGFVVRQGDQLLFAAEVEQVGVVVYADETVTVGHLILVEKNFAGAVQWRRDDEAAMTIVERRDAKPREEYGSDGFFFDGFQAYRPRGRAKDTADVNECGGIGRAGYGRWLGSCRKWGG